MRIVATLVPITVFLVGLSLGCGKWDENLDNQPRPEEIAGSEEAPDPASGAGEESSTEEAPPSTEEKGDSSGPEEAICLLDLTDNDGTKKGEICVTSKDATFNGRQQLTSGAGHAVAEPGKHLNVVLTIKCEDESKESGETYRQLELRVGRIDWNQQGKTTSVAHIEPEVRSSYGDIFRILGDLASPVVKDGSIVLRVEEKGEFSFVTKFGGYGEMSISQGLCALFSLKEVQSSP